MTYKIKHGRRTYEPPVTKKNNVNVGDAGVVPVKKTNTGNAWDTNKWRTLSDRDYNRGSGSIGVKFTFDYRFGPDPTCSAHSKVL
jgi:hypothetical protein